MTAHTPFGFDPFDLMRPLREASEIMMESQMVIGLRLAGMAGLWQMDAGEQELMLSEKLAAGADSAHAAMASGMAGGSISDMAMAMMHPVRQKTKANARRLTREVSK